jgi:hypothetical protein
MARLETFDLTIKTGESGLGVAPRYEINGFALDFDEIEGGTGPGETLKVTGNPESFPHALALIGPQEGKWDIERIDAVYHPAGGDPYTVCMGAVTLDDATNLNIWHERPQKVFDV